MASLEPRRPRRRDERPASEAPAPTPTPVSGLDAATLRRLQRSAGNAAVTRMLARQATLARNPEIEPTDVAMGQKVIDDLNAANQFKGASKGVHYAHNYRHYALVQKDPFAAKLWKEDYWNGYANPAYWNRTGFMSWQLSAMVDAAEAIKDWLAGPTIAECATVLVAIEFDTLRAAVGDARFNRMFSWWPDQPPERELLKLNQSARGSSTGGFMTGTGEGLNTVFNVVEEVGKRSVKKGEWYYFYNHPMYLLKHPGGAFQGENAICMDDTSGAQKWSGFGVPTVTEPAMLEVMARSYNGPRDERDYETLVTDYARDVADKKAPNETWQSVYARIEATRIPAAYRPGYYPDKVTVKDILDAPEFTIGTTKRKGGFVSGGGKRLDAAKVKAAGTPPLVTL
jgi:hypothetical protein